MSRTHATWLAAALATAAVALPAQGAAAPADVSAKTYRGFVSLSGTPERDASQGAAWTLSFRERARGRVRYKTCLKHLGNGTTRCYRRRTPASGRQDLFVARFVNDVGGPGRWRARWFVRGRRVAEWKFRVRPEPTG